MSTAFDGKDGTSTLGVGVRVVAVAAVVGMITLAAGRGTVVPDELAAEQPAATTPAPAVAAAPLTLPGTPLPLAMTARDPSLPADDDVVPRAKDEPAAPTF